MKKTVNIREETIKWIEKRAIRETRSFSNMMDVLLIEIILDINNNEEKNQLKLIKEA